MANRLVELHISEEIASGEFIAEDEVIETGAFVWIENIHAAAPLSTNSYIGIVFDHGGVSEQLVWSTKDSQNIDRLRHLIQGVTYDGTKKLSLVCDNGDSGALVFTANVLLRVNP